MEIINREKERDLIAGHTKLEPVIMMGLEGKSANDMHDGHIHMASEIKRLYPNAKIIGKIFTDLPLIFKEAGYYHAMRNPQTGEKVAYQHGTPTINPNPIYNMQEIYDWIHANTIIDYVIKLSIDWFTPWIGDTNKVGTAAMLPSYNLDFDNLYKPFEEIIADADRIMDEEELDMYYCNIIHSNLIRCHLIAALMGVFDYKIKAASNKDMYMTMAKNYIYRKYGGYEDYIVVDAIIDPKMGVPMASSIKDKYSPEEEDKLKQDAIKFYNDEIEPDFVTSPKWMEGKVFKQLTYSMTDLCIVPITKVI